MHCEKTGGVVYLEEYEQFALVDAFTVGGVYAFRVVVRDSINPRGDVIHYTVHQVDHWFDERAVDKYSTIIVLSQNVIFHGNKGILMEDLK